MYFHTFTRIKDIKDKNKKKIFFFFPISSIKKKKKLKTRKKNNNKKKKIEKYIARVDAYHKLGLIYSQSIQRPMCLNNGFLDNSHYWHYVIIRR